MNDCWINRVNEIAEKYFPNSNLDLAQCFYRFNGAIQGRKYFLDEFRVINSELKIIQKEIENEEKSLIRLNSLSLSPFGRIEAVIQSKKKHISDLMNFVETASQMISIKKTLYSITIMYIQTLAAIFYSATGEKPQCLRDGYYDDDDYYHGDFYNFLFDSRDLMIEMGIKLPSKSTIGQRAFELSKWDKGYGIQVYMYDCAFDYLEIKNPIY